MAGYGGLWPNRVAWKLGRSGARGEAWPPFIIPKKPPSLF